MASVAGVLESTTRAANGAPGHILRHIFGNADSDGPETGSTASFIGIIIAISGNVVISLALNCQKLAHKRLERERQSRFRCRNGEGDGLLKGRRELLGGRRLSLTSNDSILEQPELEDEVEGEDRDGLDDEDEERTRVGETSLHQSPNSDEESDYGEPIPFPGRDTPTSFRRSFRERAYSLLLETEPLLIVSNGASPRGSLRVNYGGARNGTESARESMRIEKKRDGLSLLSRLFHNRDKGKGKATVDVDVEGATVVPVRVEVTGEDNTNKTEQSGKQPKPTLKFAEPVNGPVKGNESDYLKSKLWWFGFLLMNVGELGNFISYAFAPASVVAPLGTFALIANCLFAPLMLKERFRKRDLVGVSLSILGAVTVVLSANPSDTRLGPDGLLHALGQHIFIILAVIYVVGATIFVALSSRRLGSEYVFIDVGACALFGGFTVLATKAFSSLLTLEGVTVFKEWITYPILVTLIGTGVCQIRYLNRALMKFDSKTVIPSQFVLFNLSVIISSAVLYGDFRSATFHQMVTFFYGCGATFAGVFLLTWGSNVEHEDETDDAITPNDTTGRKRAESIGRTQLVLPQTPQRNTRALPILRTRGSAVSLVGLSPAQRVLLVRTPTGQSTERDDGSNIA